MLNLGVLPICNPSRIHQQPPRHAPYLEPPLLLLLRLERLAHVAVRARPPRLRDPLVVDGHVEVVHPPRQVLPRHPRAVVPRPGGELLPRPGRQVVRLEEVVERGAEHGGDLARVQPRDQGLLDQRARRAGVRPVVGVEEGDARRDDEVRPRQRGGQAAQRLDAERPGQAEVIHRQADLLKGLPAGDLVYVPAPVSTVAALRTQRGKEREGGLYIHPPPFSPPPRTQGNMYKALSRGKREGRRAILVLTRCLFQAVGLAPRKRGMAREAPQARGPHGNNDAQVAPAVRVQQDQDGGALPGRQGVP